MCIPDLKIHVDSGDMGVALCIDLMSKDLDPDEQQEVVQTGIAVHKHWTVEGWVEVDETNHKYQEEHNHEEIEKTGP